MDTVCNTGNINGKVVNKLSSYISVCFPTIKGGNYLKISSNFAM